MVLKTTAFLFLFLFQLLTGMATHTTAQNKITGTIIDNDSNQPIEFAQIALMQRVDSSMITGSLTNHRGQFELLTSLTGQMLLRISYIGYDEHWEDIAVTSGTNRMGNIELSPAVTALGEVQITAASSLFRSEADRRIFNVENMTIAEGGTAIQVLETLPSVQLDEEGNITLRGSGNILIYINGRPTNLSADDTESILEQFPANAIRNVELITNPSARFDAEGVGGIINIVLREQRMRGFNGQVNASAGTGNKYSGGINLNKRQNRWNFFTSYSYQYRELWEENLSERENFAGNGSALINQDYYTENFDQSHLIRAGAEYDLTDQSSLRLHGSLNRRSRDRERTYNIYNLSAPGLPDSTYLRQMTEDQSRTNYETGLGYLWSNDNGRRLSVNATYSFDEQDRVEYFDQRYFDADNQEVNSKFLDQIYERPLSSTMTVFELDYEQDLSSVVKMESGLKSTLRYDNRSQAFGQRNLLSDPYQDLVLSGIPVSNHFTRDENVHAAYLILKNNEQRFSYLAGLRAEYTEVRVWQDYGLRSGFLEAERFIPARDTTSHSSYFNLFPSLFLNYEISTNQDIQASYSRRIRRPGVGSMMPFLNAQDFYNLRLGNPYLKPSFTNNYELNYIRAWEHYMLTAGVFHRQTTDGISRLFVPFEQSALVTWTNASTTDATGFELIHYLNLNSNVDATLTGNYYYSNVQGELEGIPYNNESYSWTLSLLGNANIPRWFSAQISANYWGPRIIPQGEILPVFAMNLGLRRNVLNNRGTISVNMSDVLKTRRFILNTTGEAFSQHREFTRESQVLTFSFTWRFNNFGQTSERARDNNVEGDIEGLF